MGTAPRVLVACFGNVLRADDGLGYAVAERLEAQRLPPGVEVLEVGVGGIHLVQELLTGVDVLVIVDAVDLDRLAGTVMVMRPHVVDVAALEPTQRRDQLADMHYATPERALMLAGALGILPEQTWLVGCQVTDADELGQGLSAAVHGAVDRVLAEIREVVRDCGVSWP